MSLKIYCIFSTFVSLVYASHLPSYIKPCALRSPDFSQCAIKHGNEALSVLVKGDRLNEIPPFNPLKIPFIQISSSGMEMNLTDCVFHGADQLRLVDLRWMNSTKHANCKLTTPMLRFEFEYVVTGKIASLPIGGNGHGVMDIVNATYEYDFDYDVIEKKGLQYMKIGKDSLSIEPVKIITDLQNLFGGNKQLAHYVKPCAIKSPEFQQCAVKHGNEAIPFLVKGDRTYGIPAFNPLHIPFVQIQAAGLDMNLTDSTFTGAENLKMVDLTITNATKHAELVLKGPLITLEFEYSVSGKIASLPIRGQGHGKVDLIDAIYGYEFNFNLVEKNGKSYLKVANDKIKINPTSVNTDLKNLFNGNKQLGDALNQFLNENWQELLNEFSSTLSDIYGSIARSVFERLLDKIPVDEMFTDW